MIGSNVPAWIPHDFMYRLPPNLLLISWPNFHYSCWREFLKSRSQDNHGDVRISYGVERVLNRKKSLSNDALKCYFVLNFTIQTVNILEFQVLFHWSLCLLSLCPLSLCLSYYILMLTPADLDFCSIIVSLRSNNVSSPTLFFVKIVLASLGPFHVRIFTRISLSISTQIWWDFDNDCTVSL